MLHLEEGKRYEVEGFSAPGDFAPIIVKPKMRLIGQGQMPSPKQVTLEQLSTGSYDCLRVQVHGIVRSVQQIGNRWRLELSIKERRYRYGCLHCKTRQHIHCKTQKSPQPEYALFKSVHGEPFPAPSQCAFLKRYFG